MRVAIFGGNGFLGQYLCGNLLLNNANYIKVVDRRENPTFSKSENKKFKQIIGNFSDEDLIKFSLDEVEIAFHLISTTLPANSNLNPALDLEENLISTIKFLDIACNLGVKKVIFFSSGGTIYGDSTGSKLSESDQTNPICSYGIQKLAIEKYLNLYNRMHGLDYGILRIANPFGKKQNIQKKQGFIQTAISCAIHRKPLEIWGDGNIVRDYLHAQDVADAAVGLLDYGGAHKIFNIGSGFGYSINQIISIIENLLGEKMDVKYEKSRIFDLQSNILDISLAKNELNWSPKIKLEQYIANQLSSNLR